MFNKYFTENYLKLSKQAEQEIKNALEIIQFFVGKFEAEEELFNQKEQNLKMPVISYKGDTEQEMKFQGKTIHRNTKCNTWYTRYRINGKQIYISGKTQKEVLQELKSQLNYTKKEKKKALTLLDWYNQWLELFKVGKVKQSTLDVYSSLVKHIPNNLLNKNIKDITSIDIQKLINTIVGDRTKQKLFELLKDIFTKAENNNICNNVLKCLDKPKHTKENGIALTTQDRLLFEKYCLEHEQYIFLITLYQGLRKGEVLGITKQDIDFIDKTLDINKTLNDKGKFDTTKNETSRRIMPLFEPSLLILKQVDLSKQRVFCISNAKMQSDFTKIIQDLGLNKKYTIHSLRHTFITNCQDNNIPEHIIQRWVGHSIGSSVTKSVYTHVQEDTNKANIDILNKSKFYSHSTHK